MSSPGTVNLEPQEFEIVNAILCRHIPGRPVFIFGSRATGRARRRSDLDLAIGGDPALTLHQQALLDEAFDESDLPMSVDIVDLHEAKGIFRQRIEQEWISFEVAAEQLGLKAVA